MLASVRGRTPVTPNLDKFLNVVESRSCSMTFEFPPSVEQVSPTIDYVQMGDVNVLRYQGSGLQQCWRSREHIAQDCMEHFIVSTPIRSRYGLRYGTIDQEAPPDSFVFLSTARPFQCRIKELGSDSSFAALNVRVPASLVRQRVPCVDDLCGHFVKITPGVTRAMQASFHMALADGPFMKGADTQSLGTAMLDLICGTASQLLGSDPVPVGRASVQEQIFRKATAFIDAHLSDPDLDPAVVAAQCQVSTRYLHTVFTALSEGLSCFRYIKELRLQRCREALRNADLKHRYVMDIAADWGFFDPAGFTHLYKAKFGLTPGQERK